MMGQQQQQQQQQQQGMMMQGGMQVPNQGVQNVMGQQQQQQQQQVNMPNQVGGIIRPQGPMMNQQMVQNQGNIPPINPMNQMQMNQGVGQMKGNMGPNVGPMIGMNQQMVNPQNVPVNPQNVPMNPMMNQNPMGNQMGVRGMAPSQMMNPMNPGQIQQMQNMQHMRKQQEMMMPNAGPGVPFPGQVRNTAPSFLRQSPSPMSVPSPIGLSQSQHNTMVASPAMVPSPQAPMSNPPRMQNVMAPSPSANMNTPGQPQGDYVQSPMNPHDDQIYREKYNQLTKYKEPLKKVIQRVGPENNSEKLTKLKKLLEILSNPEARIPLETLVKCEIVLVNQFGTLKEAGPASINNPLYDAISNNLQNPLANHTIQRTFKPSMEAWFGPDIKNLPPAKKRKKYFLTSITN